MAAAFVIAARILRQRLRDRSALIFAVLTPLGLAVAFSALIAPAQTSYHTSYAVYDGDQGAFSRVLLDDVFGHLVTGGVADMVPVSSEAAARVEVSAARVGAGIVVPSGFSQAIAAGTPTSVTILGRDAPSALQIARSTVQRFASSVGATQLTIATTVATAPGAGPGAGGTAGQAGPGATLDPATLDRITASVVAPGPISIVDESADRRQANTQSFYAASMAIMFLFFATQYGALSLLAERRAGTLARLLAAPIRPASVILGGALAGIGLGLVTMTVMVVATTALIGANWGPPALVALLVVAAVLAAVGVSTLVSTFAKTEEQAGGWNVIVAMTLAVLGGTFIPLAQGPELLARLSLITPHAWFLRAVDDLSVPGVGPADIAPSVAVLVTMGLLTGGLGLLRSRATLVSR